MVDRTDGNWATLIDVKRIVNPNDGPIKLIYLASGSDVAYPLAATGATDMSYIDEVDCVRQISDNVKQVGGRYRRELGLGEDRTEINFKWNKEDRKLIFHKLNITNETIGQLQADMQDIDVVFLKFSVYKGYVPTEKAIEALKIGGFFISDASSSPLHLGEDSSLTPNSLGLKEIPLKSSHNSFKWMGGGNSLLLYQKTRQMPKIGEMLEFDELFGRIRSIRNGLINDEDVGSSKSENGTGQFSELVGRGYKKKLIDLKRRFDELPSEAREEIKRRTISILVDAPDMKLDAYDIHSLGGYFEPGYERRIIVDSETGRLVPISESLARKLNLEDTQHGRELSIEDVNRWEKTIQKQFERYVEDRRNDFREVFKDGV